MELNKDLCKKLYLKDVPAVQQEKFFYLCEQYALDPIKREVWIMPDKAHSSDGWRIFCGRDGLLNIAHKSEQFAGMQSRILQIVKDQIIEVPVAISNDLVVGAICRIWRKDTNQTFESSVSLAEYDTGYNLWKTKKQTMIIKVAEGHALRRAFNISGLYIPEEIDELPETKPIAPAPKQATQQSAQKTDNKMDFIKCLEVLNAAGDKGKEIKMLAKSLGWKQSDIVAAFEFSEGNIDTILNDIQFLATNQNKIEREVISNE